MSKETEAKIAVSINVMPDCNGLNHISSMIDTLVQSLFDDKCYVVIDLLLD